MGFLGTRVLTPEAPEPPTCIIDTLPSISVVIPAFNEEDRLQSSLEKVWAYLSSGEWQGVELVVVNDGSTDRTREIVERFAAGHTGVRLVENSANRGKGYSVRHGALEAANDWVLVTDADLSAPIAELEKLLSTAEQQEADVVIGSRALDRSLIGVHQSGFREWAGRIFNLVVRLVVGLPFWDTQCGFKLFSSRAAREIFCRQRISGFGFDVEALFLARRLGFRTLEIPVRWNHVEGTKVSMFRDSLGMFADVLRIRINHLRGLYR